MRKLLTIATGITLMGALLVSCDKKIDNTPGTPETYRLTGRLDAARTTIATAALTSASFTVAYDQTNAFGDAQSIINGSFALTGYTGITASGGVADTLSFFAKQAGGADAAYIVVPTSAFSATAGVTNLYTYNNTSNASFTINNFAFTNEVTQALKSGGGYFRLGKGGKYVYILLDGVVKI